MSQSGKVGKGVLITIAVIIVSLLLGLLGYWLATKDDVTKELTTSSATTETTEATPADDAVTTETKEAYCAGDDKQLYTNELIGLEFCYPALWGTTAMSAPQGSESVNGSGYEIAFSAYDTIVSSITSDYQNTIGRGGRCEDPTNIAPDFTTYREAWVQDSSDPDLALASRYHIKKDGAYLISETVDMFSSGLCYSALINQTGTAYPVVKVALRRPLDSTSVSAHVANPTILFSSEERSDFNAVVDSVRRPE
jgi:hypothetical protein